MLQSIISLIPADPDLPERARILNIFERILDNRLYDSLPYEFHEERSPNGDYIPLRHRRPSVRYALARVIVEDSVALLFSDGHFPEIVCATQEGRDGVGRLVRATRLNSVMTETALRGSVGSVAVLLRVLRGRPFLKVMSTTYLTPEWDPTAPDTLLRVTERYKVSGAELLTRGYEVADAQASYWFMRSWDENNELWFTPTPLDQPVRLVDEARSVHHGLGFVPIVWIRNLPGGTEPDGSCTFRSAIDTSIEIDYQLSQAGRGLKYSSDPTLLIKEPAGLEGSAVRGAANALVVSEKGDAKLLEIGGTASQAVIDYVRVLRELALESVHGNRTDASRLSAPASGRALEMMNQGLLWLADNLRVSYGEGGLLPILRMMLKVHAIKPLLVDGKSLPDIPVDDIISLQWPAWYPTDSLDRQRDAETVIALVQSGQISRDAGRRMLAAHCNISDFSDAPRTGVTEAD